MNNHLLITIVADGKKYTENVRVLSSQARMAIGHMDFAVDVDSQLHDLFAIDSDVPILCACGCGINRPWFEIQSNPDNTYYVNFTRV